MKAICNALPPFLRSEGQSNLEKKRIAGHFGNQIYRLTLTIRKSNATAALNYIIQERLDEKSRNFLSRHLDKLYDPKSQEFYIRISKGKLVSDEMTVTSSDESPIRIVFKLQQYGGSQSERAERARKFLLKKIAGGVVLP